MAPIGTATGLAQGVASATARCLVTRPRGLPTAPLPAESPHLGSARFGAVSGLTVGNSRFVVLVSGDLSPREMVRVADSLKVDAQ